MTIETSRRILDTALRMFNKSGLDRVGVRDIARALSISPGNLAYHFPTKDKLVEALFQEYTATQGQVVSVAKDVDKLRGYYRGIVTGMRNHLSYRFLFQSYTEVMRSSPELTAVEIKREAVRRELYAACLKPHVAAGSLDPRLLYSRIERLRETQTILMRGWIVSATFSDVSRSDAETLAHFAKLAIGLLEPCCTKKGRQELRRILSGEFDAEVLAATRHP